MATIAEEQAAFDTMRTRLIDEGHGGRFVLFKDGQVLAMFATGDEAYREGLKRFGSSGVFVVDQVTPKKPEMLSMSWELGLMGVK
jgi:hypothetical protein